MTDKYHDEVMLLIDDLWVHLLALFLDAPYGGEEITCPSTRQVTVSALPRPASRFRLLVARARGGGREGLPANGLESAAKAPRPNAARARAAKL